MHLWIFNNFGWLGRPYMARGDRVYLTGVKKSEKIWWGEN
jgi:hypothetical protein